MKTYNPLACAMAKAVALLTLILIGTVHAHAGAIYYVDPAGNDSLAGTSQATAWATITKANSHLFVAGETLAFKVGGSWTGTELVLTGSGAKGNVVTCTCYDTSGHTGDAVLTANPAAVLPIIQSNTTDFAVLLDTESYWTISDIHIQGGERGGLFVACRNAPPLTVISGITVHGVTVDYTTSLPSSSWYGHGIYIYNQGLTQQKFDTLTIDNCTINEVMRRGISIESTEKLDWHGSPNSAGTYGGVGYNNTADASYFNTNVVIKNNTISNTRVDGIFVSGCYNFIAQYNTITDVGTLATAGNRENYNGMFWTSCVGVPNSGPNYPGLGCVVQNNTVSYTAKGPWTDTDGFFTDNDAFDLDLGNGGVHIVQYNSSHDNADGFLESLNHSLDDLVTTWVADRFIVRDNMSYEDNTNETTTNLSYAMLLQLIGRHQEVYHNTFYCGTGSGTAIVNRRGGGAIPVESGLFQDNIFYCPNGFYSCVSGLTNSTNPFTYHYNAIYGSTTGLVNPDSSALNTITATPGFVNGVHPHAFSDIMLVDTAAAVNAGLNITADPGPVLDYNSYPYDLGTTLGADQLENVINMPFENNANDISGHGNNGTKSLTGATFDPTTVHDGSYSLKLDGVAGYVDIPTSASTNLITSELAIDLWVYPTSSSGWRRLVDKATIGSTDGVILDLDGFNHVRFIVRASEILTTAIIPTNAWTHIEAISQQSGTMSVIINSGTPTTISASTNPVFSNTHHFRIGSDQSGGTLFKGYLDNVQIRHDSMPR